MLGFPSEHIGLIKCNNDIQDEILVPGIQSIGMVGGVFDLHYVEQQNGEPGQAPDSKTEPAPQLKGRLVELLSSESNRIGRIFDSHRSFRKRVGKEDHHRTVC